MLPEAKMNYKHQFGDNIWCSTCKLFPSNQEHLFSCFKMRNELKSEINFDTYTYSDIFGTLEKQERIAKLFTDILKVHQQLQERANLPTEEEDQSTEDLDSSFESVLLDATVS